MTNNRVSKILELLQELDFEVLNIVDNSELKGLKNMFHSHICYDYEITFTHRNETSSLCLIKNKNLWKWKGLTSGSFGSITIYDNISESDLTHSLFELRSNPKKHFKQLKRATRKHNRKMTRLIGDDLVSVRPIKTRKNMLNIISHLFSHLLNPLYHFKLR